MKGKKNILVLEDDVIEAMKIKRTLNNLNLNGDIVIKKNGIEGLDWLEKNHENLPNLIILDLNMPKLNGHEFLKIIKTDELLKLIPVVIFTTSSNLKDKQRSYSNYASGYITKPIDYNQYENAIRCINNYWQKCEMAY